MSDLRSKFTKEHFEEKLTVLIILLIYINNRTKDIEFKYVKSKFLI